MLLFAVFDDAGPAKDWPLRHVHLIGPDETVTPGEARFDRGLIRCERRGSEGAAGLAVQFPVKHSNAGGGGGSESLLTLRTCLLPGRTEPYLLSLELARHRLMLLLNKVEEWAFFDLPAEDPINLLIERTREAFTRALMAVSPASGAGGQWFSLEADRAAREALALGVEAGEALALHQSRVQHGRRLDGTLARAAAAQAPASALSDHEARASRAAAVGSPGLLLGELPKLGVAVSPNAFAPVLTDAVAAQADLFMTPMRWMDLEPSEGKYNAASTDRWIEWAVTKAKLPVVAGPLIEFRAGQVPDFLYIWEHDYETLRDVVINHLKKVVTRYRRTCSQWVACAGLPSSVLPMNYEQVLDLTRMCVLLIRKLHPGAKVAVELDQPWGEYAGSISNSKAGKVVPPALYAELLNQLGLNLDAISVRVQVGSPVQGRSTRDLLAISAMLDRLAALDRPLMVTLGCPSVPTVGGGQWRGPWSPEQQGQWLKAVGSMVAGKPYVQSIVWAGLTDEPGPGGEGSGLLSSTGTAKPAAGALKALRDALAGKGPLP
jgi:hypothetical protein